MIENFNSSLEDLYLKIIKDSGRARMTLGGA